MTDTIKPLYTAHATATGGRNGHTRSDDGMVDVNLSVPKEMGGPGKPGTATPEHLFAAGYAACFGGALDFIAKQHKKDASKATVKCAVTIGPRERRRLRPCGRNSTSPTRACPRPSSSRSSKKRTRRSALIATPPAATSTSS